jgi:hypothetical protein
MRLGEWLRLFHFFAGQVELQTAGSKLRWRQTVHRFLDFWQPRMISGPYLMLRVAANRVVQTVLPGRSAKMAGAFEFLE